jgi:hypothetical protein
VVVNTDLPDAFRYIQTDLEIKGFNGFGLEEEG